MKPRFEPRVFACVTAEIAWKRLLCERLPDMARQSSPCVAATHSDARQVRASGGNSQHIAAQKAIRRRVYEYGEGGCLR